MQGISALPISLKSLIPRANLHQSLLAGIGNQRAPSLVCTPPLVTSVRTHLGYIPFQGRLGRKLTNRELFLKELKIANIQPAKKITYTFDPMREDYQSIRNFMHFWNKPKVLETNLKVLVKTDLVDDRRPPLITFELNDGRTLEVKTSLLTELEIARVVNHYLLPLVKEEVASTETKASKAAAGGAKGGKKKR